MSLDIESVINWILKHPDSYPGKHNNPQARASESVKPLEPKSQLILIWRALGDYIGEKLRAGQSVNIKGFGMFTYDIDTDLPRIATKNIDPNKEIDQQRMERKHLHVIRPCFVVDPALQYHLYHYPGKEQVSKPKSQHSSFQRGFSTIFCNPVPIANACLLRRDVVEDALKAFVKAFADLVKYNKDMMLNFGFCIMTIMDRNLKTRFRSGFDRTVKDKTFEDKMRRSLSPCSTFWKTSYNTKWANSTLSSLTKRPHTPMVKTLAEKVSALKLMSLDMVSHGKIMPKGARKPLF